MTRLFIFNGLLLLAVFAFLEWSIRRQAAFDPPLLGSMEKMQVIKEPQAAPPITFTQITSAPPSSEAAPTIQKRALAELRGQWVLVNFWATWCAPCLTELPAFERLAARYGARDNKGDNKVDSKEDGTEKDRERFSVIAIAMDRDMTARSLLDFLAKHTIDTKVAGYFDEAGGMAQTLRLRGYPTTWIIDPYGRIVGILEGEAAWDSPEAFALFDSFLRPNDLHKDDLQTDEGTAQNSATE